jgi:hypothetical protein
MNRKLFGAFLAILAALSCSRAAAAVLSYTVGIDVNCPSGLGE